MLDTTNCTECGTQIYELYGQWFSYQDSHVECSNGDLYHHAPMLHILYLRYAAAEREYTRVHRELTEARDAYARELYAHPELTDR